MQGADQSPVIVGNIGAPHGVQGWVRINSYTDPLENIFSYPLLMQAGHHAEWQPLEIETYSPHGNGFIAKLANVTDRDQAALLTNAKLAVMRDDFPDLEDNEHYWADIIGLAVENQDGIALGKVADFFDTGANEVMVVRDTTSGKEHLIPYIPEMYILEVDIPAGKMRVEWDPEL